ncbi:BTB/POZ domain-containing protein 17 [Scleropages formosus]|nr:BTB/POZ domain-containing protein 17-like [Scleropages formosus]
MDEGLSVSLPQTAAPRQEVAESGLTVIDHSAALLQQLEALLARGNISDVALRVQTAGSDRVKAFQVHALVLSLQSEVLRDLVQSHSSGILVLEESPECADVFDKFIRYLYCGEITVRLDQALPLHKLASKYHVRGLQTGLSLYMTQHLAADVPGGHVAGWYQYAVEAGDAVLRDSCLQYLAWNLSAVIQSGGWTGLDEELLLTLLRRSDLVLRSELELFEALEEWMARNQPGALTAESALRAVRYAMIPPLELFRLQKQSAALARYGESVRDLLHMAYQFHSASPLQLAKYFDVNCSLFAPRNYLSPVWGSPWVIGNPARDDRSGSFQTQLGPSAHDAGKRLTWNVLFSPRWLSGAPRPTFAEQGAVQGPHAADGSPPLKEGHPCVMVTPATSSADLAGVSFQKTVIVLARPQGKAVVRHIYNFHQSTDETGDFLADADLQRRTSEYLIDGSLYLHVVVKPLYHSLVVTRK